MKYLPPFVFRRQVFVLLGLALLLWAAQARAAELVWRNRPFQITANEKPLADFLRELSASQGTTAIVDPKVTGVISGKFTISGARGLLSSICEANGLTWYFDGSFLFVEPAGNAMGEVLSIPAGSAARINEILTQLKIADSRYPLAISDSDGTVFVSGPKRYVDMVRQAIKGVDRRATQVDSTEIRLFPLKYAWAADVSIKRSGKEVSIAGVATTLRSLYSRNTAGAGRPASAPFKLGPDRQIKMRARDAGSAPKFDLSSPSEPDDGGGPDETKNEVPYFRADTRLNAVLVRDTPERMVQYARLIEALDVRPRLVEIEVTIMDISTDTLDSLGVDWRLHGKHFDLQTGTGGRVLNWANGTTEAGQVGGTNASGPTAPLGAVFTASIGNEMRNFLLTRVSALAQKGHANFVARPKVLTLDNTEALLENLSEIHVRVQGFQDAGLFNITSGTAVRVTPLIVDEKAGRSVLLTINIEDGSLSNTSAVDQIPVINRRTVNTQALIDEGTSLLLAGFTSEEKVSATSGVPLLSDIPLVGKLFKFTEDKRANMERFYLLTPRLVVPSAAAAASVPAGG
jgi:type III secretion protein C